MFFLKNLGPEWFKKLREASRKDFHLVAPPNTAVVPSYDQKTEKVNEYWINEYQMLKCWTLPVARWTDLR